MRARGASGRSAARAADDTPDAADREACRDPAALRAALDAEIARRNELVAIVGHELRTPITVIGGFSRLLLRGDAGPLADEQRRIVEQMQKSCARLDAFVHMLLRATRDEREAASVRPRDAALLPVLEGVAAFLRPMLEEREITLALEPDPRALRAHFDPERIEQVLVNLVGNALKYAPPGTAIEVRTRLGAAGREVVVEVADDGPGIPERERGRVFEPYVRGANGGGGDGLGLGLAICRRIVEAHGGRIAVSGGGARGAAGACFTFTLPAAETKDDDVPRPSAASAEEQAGR